MKCWVIIGKVSEIKTADICSLLLNKISSMSPTSVSFVFLPLDYWC